MAVLNLLCSEIVQFLESIDQKIQVYLAVSTPGSDTLYTTY